MIFTMEQEDVEGSSHGLY